jgi:hypothetical protein
LHEWAAGIQIAILREQSMSSITLRFFAEPGAVNFGGKVPGGTVMKWIDEAGNACATRWSKPPASRFRSAASGSKSPS